MFKKGFGFAFSFTFILSLTGFPKAKLLADTVLDFPGYTKLSDDELNRVVSLLREIDKETELENQHHR